MSSFDASNPLLSAWTENHGLPPFSLIKPAHFEPAFDIAMKQNIEELKVIANNVEPTTFENTIAAFDRSGSLHTKIYNCFDNLCGSNGVPELQEVELKMAGPLAAHNSQVYTLPGLFAKIDAVHETRQSLNLNSEQLRLVERFHLDFVRAGAKFDAAAQTRYAAITEEQANLETKFTQNILADESEITIQLTKEDLSGLPEDLIASARQAAVDRKIEAEDAYVITLSRSLVEPFITYSTRRDLREKAWRLWTSRGELDAARDNLSVARRLLVLRLEQARMHGYQSYAEYATADTMAGSPDRVLELLESVWSRGKESIHKERLELETYMATHSESTPSTSSNSDTTIEPWDWRFYAERVRQSQYDLDEEEVKPYFSLERMLEAIFDVAGKLFGLSFTLR